MSLPERARDLRRNAIRAEQLLWHHLRARQLGYKFRCQVPKGHYIADFICSEKGLVIEADGSQHRENPNDAVRDA